MVALVRRSWFVSDLSPRRAPSPRTAQKVALDFLPLFPIFWIYNPLFFDAQDSVAWLDTAFPLYGGEILQGLRNSKFGSIRSLWE